LQKRLALLIAAIVALISVEPAMAIEQPKYDLKVKDGDFELRQYGPYIVAEVLVSGDQGHAVQSGFRKLAGYIFGGNAGRATVQFMMPAAYTLNSLPKPNDADIRFRSEPAREMAVMKFSGVARERSYREKTNLLKSWVAAKGLAVRGSAVLAQYDPPWTPWFMRRNEVLIEIAH
jgi:hypothetical protein